MKYLFTLLLIAGCASTSRTGTGCKIGGCSGELCLGENESRQSACLFLPGYGCFKHSKCEKQPSGLCGWTETPAYKACTSTLGLQ